MRKKMTAGQEIIASARQALAFAAGRFTTTRIRASHEVRPTRKPWLLRDREADDAWEAYRRTRQFASNAAVMAWLEGPLRVIALTQTGVR